MVLLEDKDLLISGRRRAWRSAASVSCGAVVFRARESTVASAQPEDHLVTQSVVGTFTGGGRWLGEENKGGTEQ